MRKRDPHDVGQRCLAKVLVDEAAHDVAPPHQAAGHGDRAGRRAALLEPLMRAGLVVVRDLRGEHPPPVARAERTRRSACAFAVGAREGVGTTSIPSVTNTASNAGGNVASRS